MTGKAIAARAGVLAVVSLLAGCGGRDSGVADDAGDAPVDPFVSFDTPTALADGGTPGCGRVSITDLHVDSDGSPSTAPVPASCAAGDLTPDEKILEYMLLGPRCQTQPVKVGPPGLGGDE